MRTVALIREYTSYQGTPGWVYVKNPETNQMDYFSRSLELPWRNNLPSISCIPTGSYVCKWTYSPTFKRMMYILLEDYEHRSGIRIHPASFAGDITQGYKCDLLGCIALGKGFIGGPNTGRQLLMHTSRVTMKKFEEEMAGEDFLLIITGEMPCLD